MAKRHTPNLRPVTVQLQVDVELDTSADLWIQLRRYFGEKFDEGQRPRNYSIINE